MKNFVMIRNISFLAMLFLTIIHNNEDAYLLINSACIKQAKTNQQNKEQTGSEDRKGFTRLTIAWKREEKNSEISFK